VGATWIFTRSGTVWTQQGVKLVGTGYSGNSNQGERIALSADGNTMAVGGRQDDDESTQQAGAVWMFTRSGTVWTQQGLKLRGTGYSGDAAQGRSVALSADGNTLAFGGDGDDGGGTDTGSFYVFTRTNTTWTQQGLKMVGTGFSGSNVQQGASIAISGDGNTLAIGANECHDFTYTVQAGDPDPLQNCVEVHSDPAGAKTDDRDVVMEMSEELIGIFVADAGYIKKELSREFYQENKRVLLAKPRKNMKKIMTKLEELLYQTRMLIEINFRELKLFYGLITSLPRSVGGYLANYIYSILAYQIV